MVIEVQQFTLDCTHVSARSSRLAQLGYELGTQSRDTPNACRHASEIYPTGTVVIQFILLPEAALRKQVSPTREE